MYNHQNNDLTLAHKLISTEAFNLNVITNANKLTSFLDSFSSSVKESLSGFTPLSGKLVRGKDFKDVLEETKYIHLMDVEIYRPEGMIGTYTKTINVLEEWDRDILDLQERLLSPLIVWISQLLAKPESLAKLPSKVPFTTVDTEGLKKSMGNVFSSKENGTIVTYSEAVTNNSEWGTNLGRLEKLRENFGEINLKGLKKSVDEIVRLSKLLSTRIKEDPETYKTSKAVLRTLADSVYSVALEVELVGLYGYRLKSVETAVADSYDRLKEITKRS